MPKTEEWTIEYRFPNENGWQRHWTNLPIEDKAQAHKIWKQMCDKYPHLQWRARYRLEETPFVSLSTVDGRSEVY